MKPADASIALKLASGRVQMIQRSQATTTISDRTLLQFASVFAKIGQKKRAREEHRHAQKAA